MTDDILTRRRRLLQGAVGGAALLAGCTGLGSDDDNDGTNDGTADGDGTGDDPDDGADDDPDDGTGDDPDDGTGDDPDDGNGDDPDDGNGDDPDDDPEEPGEGERQVGIVAALGFETQQALQQLQIQLQQGNIDEEEFEEELENLLEPILQDLSAVIEDDTDGRVVEMRPDVGAVRVNGPAEALIDVVELPDADALVASGDLDPDEEPIP